MDFLHELEDLALLGQNALDEFLRGAVLEGVFAVGVLVVEVEDRPVDRVACGLLACLPLAFVVGGGGQLVQPSLGLGLFRIALGKAPENGLGVLGLLFQFVGTGGGGLRSFPMRRCRGDCIVEQGFEVDLPGLVGFTTLLGHEPLPALRHVVDLHRLGLAVLFATLGKREFVIPDGLRGAGAVEEQQIGGNVGVRREGALGKTDDGVEVVVLEHFFFDAGAHAVAEEHPVGNDNRRPSGLALREALEFAHDELKEEKRRLGRLLVGGEVVENAALLLSAEGRIGEDDVHAVGIADFGDFLGQRVAVADVGVLEAVQEEVHLHEHVGKRLGLLAEKRLLLEHPAVGNGFAHRCEVVVGLDQEPSGAAGGIEHGFAKLGIRDVDHELHHRTGRVELAAVAGGIAHLPQHVLVETAEGVHFFAGGEVNVGDFVDDVPQEVAGLHPVRDALEHVGDHVLPTASGLGLQAAQVGEEAGAFRAIGTQGFVLRDELQQFVAGDALGFCSPVPPAVRRVDDSAVFLPRQFRLLLRADFHVVEELQEHDPGEERKAVEIAIKPFVLAHDLARGLDDRAEALGGGHGLRRLLLDGGFLSSSFLGHG